jgi:uncharacterized membrane protein YgcG
MVIAIAASLLIPICSVLAKPHYPTHPANAGYVNDFVGLMTHEQKSKLERELRDFEK